MNRESTTTFYKLSIALIGGVCVFLAIKNIKPEALNWKLAAIVLFTILIAPRMSIALPRSKTVISFSDSIIFLSFLLFGGEAAIIVACAENLSTCCYFKIKKVEGVKFSFSTILFNLGYIAFCTGITYLLWKLISKAANFGSDLSLTTTLIPALGVLALSQFITSSVIASIFYALKFGITPWQAWKKEVFSSSITYFAGAGLAGIFFKLLNYADIYSIAISLIAFGIIYYNYRQIIGEMTSSIEQAEQAERDKAAAEREKRLEIEKYAEELSKTLRKEEANGKALRKSERAFQHAALHDSLTKLPNRAYFGEILRELIEDNKAGADSKAYVLFLDLTRFKNINDSLGHSIGDKVLMIVARRFSKMIRNTDKIARLGGDEFAIILRGLATDEKAEKVAWKIHQAIAQSFTLSKNKIHISVNIGIAPCRAEYDTPEEILRDADIAMHDAKEKGSGVAFFNKELRDRFLEEAKLEAELPFAVERGELSMHYQPIVSLTDGSLTGFEALLRWNHHKLGFISPVKFIPIAENTGLIIPITNWILRETCRQIADWRKLSFATADLMVSVNISGKHLSNTSLINDVKKALAEANLSPSSLKLEITESAAMENAEKTIHILEVLKDLGVQLSIDDFGTGYSSLSYLHRFPIDTLKIDRSFVNSVGENGEDSEILQTIISLAKNLNMRVIAEGIETESQLNILKNLGCDYGQGYLMSKPQPKDVMEESLHQKQYWLPVSRAGEKAARKANRAKEENVTVF